MKKKLLTAIIAFIAITMSSSAYAQVSQKAAGTYAGTLEVYMMEPNKIPLGSSAENIYLTSTDANHVTLEIRNFSFPLVGELGDIVIPDVALEEEGDVINILPKTVKITLKVVGEVNVILNKSTIKDKEITLSLNVETTPPYPDMYIYVDFKGTMNATGISDVTLNKPTVYYNPSIDAIMVQGAENQKYDIFNVTGMQILSGVLNTEEVSVSTLSRGLYLIKIGNTTVKFIKK
jgi:hypothetical protein